MKMRIIAAAVLALGTALTGLAPSTALGAGQEKAAPAGEKLLRGARVVKMQALPGDTVHAGPHAILIDPATGRGARSMHLANPESAVVPALHQHAKGQYSLSWLTFGPGPAAGAARREIGAHADPVVIPDDFARVADPRGARFRMATEGERKVVREYTSDALVAWTRHDSAVRMEKDDGPGRRTASSYSEKGEKIGEAPAGGVRLEAARMDPNPVVTGTPTSVAVDWRNDSGREVRVALAARVSPADGKFADGSCEVTEKLDVPPGSSSRKLASLFIPSRSGTVPLSIDFLILPEAGDVTTVNLVTMVDGPFQGVRGVAKAPDGSNVEVPARLDGNRVSGGGGGSDRRWAMAATGGALAGLVAIDWFLRPAAGEEAKLTTVSVVYGDDLPSAVERGMTQIEWRPADEGGQDAAPRAEDCRYVVSETPGQTGTLTFELYTQLGQERIVVREPNKDLPFNGNAFTKIGHVNVTFRADGTIQFMGEATESRGESLSLDFDRSNRRTIHVKHVPGPRCRDGSRPVCEPAPDGEVRLSALVNHTAGAANGTGLLGAHSKFWTEGIDPDATREAWFEAKKVKGNGITYAVTDPRQRMQGVEVPDTQWPNTMAHQGRTYEAGHFHVQNTMRIRISSLKNQTLTFSGTCLVARMTLPIRHDCHSR